MELLESFKLFELDYFVFMNVINDDTNAFRYVMQANIGKKRVLKCGRNREFLNCYTCSVHVGLVVSAWVVVASVDQ